MNTWIFSKNGVVTKPLDLVKAKKYVVENPDSYGWQSSFTQWLPVHSINEFSSLLPKQEATEIVPQKIVDEFRSKEQALDARFDELNKELTAGELNAQTFAQEIATYKELTVNLSDEVKNNISEIEQQYYALVKQLKTYKLEIKSSQSALDNVVTVFNEKLSTKSVIKEPVKTEVDSAVEAELESKADSKVELAVDKEQVTAKPANAKIELVEKANSKTEVTDAKETNTTAGEQNKVKAISTRVPKPQGAKVISTRSKHPNSVRMSTAAQSDKKIEKISPAASDIASNDKPESVEKVEPTLASFKAVKDGGSAPLEQEHQANNLHTKLESGVKNIFKSVFNKDQPTESKNNFAELVQQNKVNEEVKAVKKVTEIEEAVQVETHEDEAQSKPRKRRRR